MNFIIRDLKLNILSGFISLFIYFILIFLIFGNFKMTQQNINYGDDNKNETFENIDFSKKINVDQIISLKDLPKEVKTMAKDSKITLPDVSQSESKQKKANLKDAFSNVNTGENKVNLKENFKDIDKILEEQKRFDELKRLKDISESSEGISQSLQSLSDIKKSIEEVVKNTKSNETVRESIQINQQNKDENSTIESSFSAEKYDEWYAQIQRIISKWRPTYNTPAKMSAKVRIRSDGSFIFLGIVTGSGFIDFDSNVTSFLRSLEMVTFPVPPTNKNEDINLNFEAKIN